MMKTPRTTVSRIITDLPLRIAVIRRIDSEGGRSRAGSYRLRLSS